MNGAVLQVRSLSVVFGDTTVVDDVSFDLAPHETLALVGESGSGKSVTALSIMRLIDLVPGAEITGGRVLLRADRGKVDLTQLSRREMRSIRGREISMIFQDPLASLNPVLSIGDQVAEVLRIHRKLSRRDALKGATEMLTRVRIPDARRVVRQYPHELSGGMRQRVVIAMALACEPKVLIADEPTTALDVTIQEQVLGLMQVLQEEFAMAVLFISHNMGVVAQIADRVMVMQRARIVEEGPVERIFREPEAAYTRTLLAAVPRLGSMAGRDGPMRFSIGAGA